MYAALNSFGVRGLEGFGVSVEVDISGGLPSLSIVGLPDSSVKESADRVRAALKNLDYKWPASRITVNLAPGDVRKTGPVYDLPILMAVLAASGQIAPPAADTAFVGELALDGTLRPVAGVLPMALAAAENGIRALYLPAENAAEAAAAAQQHGSLTIYPARTAKEVVQALAGTQPLSPAPVQAFRPEEGWADIPDFADVRGQFLARRALEIAAAGGHNILLVGSPGTGKSMLAKRLPGILPPLTRAEAVEVTKIYSVAGRLPAGSGLVARRPFRSPHHSVSAAALAGGGTAFKPGEVSLADRGVLFLDELPEFSREALEVLRQPLEDGQVTVSRVAGSATYPSHILLAAAMNPCKCGYYGHPTRPCSCQPSAIERYRGRISGPLLDRIDLHVEMEPIAYDALAGSEAGESSASIRARVLEARARQQQRFEALGLTGKSCNADLTSADIRKVCKLTKPAAAALRSAYDELALSARGYDRVLRVARTIADLAGQEIIGEDAVFEALQYRALDRKLWFSE
ncbi:MAG: YifB family Mg chelatase-like AAA ATPase [Faecalibacterium sp.]|nr:YifB family Mg chelatase-like AAA ATPase [Faecalibacterium sp.]